MSRWSLAMLAVATLTVACYEDDSTSSTNSRPVTNVLLTDAPFPFDTVQSVDVYIVSVAVSPDADTGASANDMHWVTVAEPHRQINLLELQQGDTALLGGEEDRAAVAREMEFPQQAKPPWRWIVRRTRMCP